MNIWVLKAFNSTNMLIPLSTFKRKTWIQSWQRVKYLLQICQEPMGASPENTQGGGEKRTNVLVVSLKGVCVCMCNIYINFLVGPKSKNNFLS